MRSFDAIAVGSGSVYAILEEMIERNPRTKLAVIDKDEPGGICLTRGCIPSKMLLYPADVVRLLERSAEFGVHSTLSSVSFAEVMHRMHHRVDPGIERAGNTFSTSENLAYFRAPAQFVAPSTLEVAGERLTAPLIFLCTGSQPRIPSIPGLADSGFLTSDTVLQLEELPARLGILGGGFIACEYAHFFSAMGAQVTLVGHNSRLLPDEDPEVSQFVAGALGQRVGLRLNQEVLAVERTSAGSVAVHHRTRDTGDLSSVEVDRLLVATGREPTSGILHPERAGVSQTPVGWIRVNEFLETTAPGVWAMGDATGRFPFKHKANYDATVVLHNALDGTRTAVDYHAVPHAVFTDPEVAGVGLTEPEALSEVGPDRLLVGRCRMEQTVKGQAMGATGFCKALVEKDSLRILGTHIVGPHASLLVQEVVTLLNTPSRSAAPIIDGMHIHPALSEVVDWAFARLLPYRAARAPPTGGAG
ncbi:MAG: dihydrolipoyl dehydrogenase [Thermoplasmata archaeon]|nr:dihydrolipoyl dehydrogenase [Thermoplasmata archaeon]